MHKFKKYLAGILLGALSIMPFAGLAQAFDVTLSGVADGGWYNHDVRPVYSATDGANVTATLNGGNVASNTLISKEGRYWLTVTARSGSETKFKFAEFYIDKTAPVIAISGVSNGATYASGVTYHFTANEGTVVAYLNGSKTQTGTSVYSDGNYSLVVNAVDKAGNTASRTVSFAIDTSTDNGGGDVINNNETTNNSTTTQVINRYFGGVSQAKAQDSVNEEEVVIEDNGLDSIKITRVENADVVGDSLNSCNNIRIVGTAKEGLLVILYLDRADSDIPYIGFVKADGNNRFEFVTDSPLPAGEYTIYAKAAQEAGETGPLLQVGHFSVEKCSWWMVWIWVLIILVLLILGFLLGWWLRRHRRDEDEQIDNQPFNPADYTHQDRL